MAMRAAKVREREAVAVAHECQLNHGSPGSGPTARDSREEDSALSLSLSTREVVE